MWTINDIATQFTKKERDIWDAKTLFHAIEICDDKRLKLAMNLAFSCTLRMGELLALTWDCVDITPESIMNGNACIQVTKELQRISRSAMKELDGKDILFEFPVKSSKNTTQLIIKRPKTESSVRRIYLPKSVAQMLIEWKCVQEAEKEALGVEYADYNLVIAGPLGLPTENSTINEAFRRLIIENDLPPVVFHSLRHSSITYKLKLTGGDIKSVQGDSGHSQAEMVTDQYSHILDEGRQRNAKLFEEKFYSGKGDETFSLPESNRSRNTEEGNTELLAKLLANPETAALLKALAQKL